MADESTSLEREPVRLAIVSASLSESSSTKQLGTKLAGLAVEFLKAAQLGDIQVDVVELRDLAHALTDTLLTGFPNDAVSAAFQTVENADALIAVTPAYNASYSGLFKIFFDALPLDVLSGKPVLLGATGGTPRHSLVTEHALRPLFVYLHAMVVPTAIFMATEDFGIHAADSSSDDTAASRSRLARGAQELAQLVALYRGSELLANSDARSATSGGASRESKRSVRRHVVVDDGADAAELLQADPTELFQDFQSFDQLTNTKE